MNSVIYAKAYTEVLELLKQLPIEEYDRIPKSEIEYYEKNRDISYDFKLKKFKPIEEQEISVEANSIIINIFKNYFATDIQKKKLEQILKENSQKLEQEKNEKYSAENLFINKTLEYTEQTEMIVYKEKNSFLKMLDKILSFFKRGEKNERTNKKNMGK